MKLLRYSITVASLVVCGATQALPVLYSNNAGTPYVEQFDTTTGAKINSFTAGTLNGRGVVVVGDLIYTSNANNGTIRVYDRVTGVEQVGLAFTIAGANGISTISYDGDNFWTSDYAGQNKAYYVDTAGNVLKTVTLSESQGYYDGLEFFDGKLIANRFDGGLQGGNQYSVYDTDGNLLIKDFIDTTGHGNGTGIAYDGVNFYISDIFHGRATIWDGTTGAYLGELMLTGTANVIEDLSFDFEGRPDTCRVDCEPPSETVPEPGTLLLIASGMLGLGFSRRRRSLAAK